MLGRTLEELANLLRGSLKKHFQKAIPVKRRVAVALWSLRQLKFSYSGTTSKTLTVGKPTAVEFTKKFSEVLTVLKLAVSFLFKYYSK